MLHQSAIEGYFAQQEGLLVEAVSRLVRIDSTLGPAQPGQPLWPRPGSRFGGLPLPGPGMGPSRGRTAPAMWAPWT